jgi:hypothetical protein
LSPVMRRREGQLQFLRFQQGGVGLVARTSVARLASHVQAFLRWPRKLRKAGYLAPPQGPQRDDGPC